MKHADDHRVHARFDRRRRRRPDAPAGRAPRRLPRDSELARAPPRRRQRSRRTPGKSRIAANSIGPSLIVLTRQNLPTLDRTKYAPAAGVATRRLHPGRRAGKRQAGRDPHGHRQRAAARRRGLRETRRRRHQAAASSACRRSSCSTSSRQPTATKCCRRRSPPASPSKPASANAGTSTSAPSGAFVGLDTYGASAPVPGNLQAPRHHRRRRRRQGPRTLQKIACPAACGIAPAFHSCAALFLAAFRASHDNGI